MTSSSTGPLLRGSADTRLLAYVADLEVEVDRLRRNNRRMYQEARAVVDRVQPLDLLGERGVHGDRVRRHHG